MSRYHRSERDIMRDLVIAFWHPRYDGVPAIEAMQDLKRRRGEYV